DPVTGETKVNARLDYANYAGALATSGNLVFLGHIDGTFSAYDAKTLKELWSFNVGTGINAPPITYAVNGRGAGGFSSAKQHHPPGARAQAHLDSVDAVRFWAETARGA